MSKNQLGLFDGTDVKPANTKLIDYGIQNDRSHYRAHVAYLVQYVYIFPTESGRLALERNTYREASVTTAGIETAKGFPVPISHIERLQEVLIPRDVYDRFSIENYMSTGEKGRRATYIVADMLRSGLIALPVNVNLAESKALQISGTDILIASQLHIQVKCDYRGGNRQYGGTGNLFIQTSECNPFRQY